MRGPALLSHGSDLLNDGTVLQGGSATCSFFDEAQTKVNSDGALNTPLPRSAAPHSNGAGGEAGSNGASPGGCV